MASRGVNKVILIGYLGSDPIVRYNQNKEPIASVSLGTSVTWKDKQTGENRDKTEWHRVVIFGKLAEIAKDYFSKGMQVYVEGILQTRKWQDNNGIDRYVTEVVINSFGGSLLMLHNKKESTQAPQAEPPQDFSDDIPF